MKIVGKVRDNPDGTTTLDFGGFNHDFPSGATITLEWDDDFHQCVHAESLRLGMRKVEGRWYIVGSQKAYFERVGPINACAWCHKRFDA